jgi:hypothetical protein
MATLAKDKLKNVVYDNGEQRRLDFEQYVNVHKQQHFIMEGLVEHRYTGIDPQYKATVSRRISLTQSILASCPMSNCTNFDSCVTLY